MTADAAFDAAFEITDMLCLRSYLIPVGVWTAALEKEQACVIIFCIVIISVMGYN